MTTIIATSTAMMPSQMATGIEIGIGIGSVDEEGSALCVEGIALTLSDL